MRLLELRKELKLTQTDIANKLFITQNGYASYENGRTEPNIETLIKLADIFNVSVDYLIGRTNNNITFSQYSKEKTYLLNTIEKLNKENTLKASLYITGLLDGQTNAI